MGGPIFERTNVEHPAKLLNQRFSGVTRVPFGAHITVPLFCEVARLLLQLAFGRGFPWVRQNSGICGKSSMQSDAEQHPTKW